MTPDEITGSAVRFLNTMASLIPCSCPSGHGGSIRSRHVSDCFWDLWFEGFLSGLACAGITEADLPDIPVRRIDGTDTEA